MHESFYFREEMAAREREVQAQADAEVSASLPEPVAEDPPVAAPPLYADEIVPTTEAVVANPPTDTVDDPGMEEIPTAALATVSERLTTPLQNKSIDNTSVVAPPAETQRVATLKTIPFRVIEVPHDTPPTMPIVLSVPVKPPRRKRRGVLLAVASFFTTMVVAMGALVAFQPTFFTGTTVITTAPAQTTNATPIPVKKTSTPTPALSIQARNALNGCAAGAPHPYADTVYSGQYPTSSLPVPNEIALTFDDGPTPYSTPTILSFLEATHTPATFFVEGDFAATWPGLVRREWNDGFAIGMHTWNHPELPLLPDAAFPHQFGDALQAIHHAIGKDACIWLMRPPYGETNRRVLNVAMSYGLTTINWNDSSADWKRYGATVIAATVLAHIHPGAIVLMHDGPAEREQTAEALPLILAGLKARGLTPVTIPQLLEDGHFPGVVVKTPPSQPGSTPTPTRTPLPVTPTPVLALVSDARRG